jgi:hypothetical protein
VHIAETYCLFVSAQRGSGVAAFNRRICISVCISSIDLTVIVLCAVRLEILVRVCIDIQQKPIELCMVVWLDCRRVFFTFF